MNVCLLKCQKNNNNNTRVLSKSWFGMMKKKKKMLVGLIKDRVMIKTVLDSKGYL